MTIVGGHPKGDDDKTKIKLRFYLEEYKARGNIEDLILAAETSEWHGVSELGSLVARELRKQETKGAFNRRIWYELDVIYEALVRQGLKKELIFDRMAKLKDIDPQSMKRMWYARKKKLKTKK